MSEDNQDDVADKVDRWYTTEEAAQLLGVSSRTIRRRIQSDQLKSKLEKGIRYVRIDDEDALTDKEDTREGQSGQPDLLEQLQSEVEYLREQVTELRAELKEKDEYLQTELKRKDEQSEQTKERSDTIILQLTRQLENQQKLLEYHREPFWRRWFKRGKEEKLD